MTEPAWLLDLRRTYRNGITYADRAAQMRDHIIIRLLAHVDELRGRLEKHADVSFDAVDALDDGSVVFDYSDKDVPQRLLDLAVGSVGLLERQTPPEVKP